MNSMSLLVFLIFSSNSRGNNFLEISSIGEVSDDGYEYSEGIRSGPISTDSDNEREGRVVGYATSTPRMNTESSLLSEDESAGVGDRFSTHLEDGFNDYDKTSAKSMPEMRKVASGGVYPAITYEYEYYKNIQTNETKDGAVPKRRDLNNWKDSDAILEVSDYNTRDASHDYYEEDPYLSEKHTSEGGISYPQYYQKNYYYNYYPLVNGRRYLTPSARETYETEGSNRRPEITGPSKFKKVNPCRQYLEFLRYIFQKLDSNTDYQYDYYEYGDEWRDAELHGNQNLFGTRLVGPTLYVDNSGRAYQLNNREGGFPVDNRIYPVSRDPVTGTEGAKTDPTTLIEKYGTGHLEIHTSFSSPSLTNSNWSRTGYPTTGLSTEESLLSKYRAKTLYSTTEQTTDMIDYQLTSSRTYQTTQTTPYNIEHSAGETEVTSVESDFPLTTSNPTTTTAYPTLFNSEDYNSVLGNAFENSEPTVDNLNSSLFYWFPRNSKFEKTNTTTPILSASPANGLSSKTLVSLDTLVKGEKEVDCNDHMLPCPDTINITYPLNGYCNRYVSCELGRAIRKTCPDGLHFNIIIKSCDIPHNSFCTYSCPESNGYFGIPGDCSGYFACKNFAPEYRMCPPRMHWNPRRNMCTFSELSQCPMKCLKANEVKHYEGDCKAYIICLNHFPYYHKCPPNTKFDRRSLSCIPDHLSNCEDDPKLLTKTLNPTLVCRDIEMKLGTRSWCSFFKS